MYSALYRLLPYPSTIFVTTESEERLICEPNSYNSYFGSFKDKGEP